MWSRPSDAVRRGLPILLARGCWPRGCVARQGAASEVAALRPVHGGADVEVEDRGRQVQRCAGVGDVDDAAEASLDRRGVDQQVGLLRPRVRSGPPHPRGQRVADGRDLRIGEDHPRRALTFGGHRDARAALTENRVGGHPGLVLGQCGEERRPFTFPIAYSQSLARIESSTSIGPPGSRPTVSSPIGALERAARARPTTFPPAAAKASQYAPLVTRNCPSPGNFRDRPDGTAAQKTTISRAK